MGTTQLYIGCTLGTLPLQGIMDVINLNSMIHITYTSFMYSKTNLSENSVCLPKRYFILS